MKLYIVLVNHHIGDSPEYELSCEVFTDKQKAIDYQAEKRNEFPIRWGGDHNHVELFEKEI